MTTETLRELLADPATEVESMRELTIIELEAVSGGCVCGGPNCNPSQCDKPSPRIP